MRKPPAFQFYADDFLAGTASMTAEEVGGYIRLLCYQWSNGSIPTDTNRSARIAGMAESSLSHVLAKFKIMADGKLCNERLEFERQKQNAFRMERAESGKKGAISRWCNGSATADIIAKPMAEGMAKNGSPSPSPFPTPTPIPSHTWKKGMQGEGTDLVTKTTQFS